MTVRPIPFSPAMVRALLDGQKFMTRRVLKPQPKNIAWDAEQGPDGTWRLRSPRFNVTEPLHVPYAIRDLLWVREHHTATCITDDRSVSLDFPVKASGFPSSIKDFWPERCRLPNVDALRPPMFLPLEFSRLTLRVTEVRVQRLQEISEEDIWAEGIAPPSETMTIQECLARAAKFGTGESAPRTAFAWLWNSLNEQRGFGWDVNPWVCAISFEVIAENVDAVLAREAV